MMTSRKSSLSRPPRLRNAGPAAIGMVAIALTACERQFTHADPDAATKLAAIATDDIGNNPELQQSAMILGARIYSAACSSCHGADPKGIPRQIELAPKNLSPQSVQEAITFDRHVAATALLNKLTLGEIKAVSVYVSTLTDRG